jgi:hypothetical protein
MSDLIVQEIRRIRQEHARKFNFDLDAIFNDFKEKERKSGRVTVRLPPRPPRPTLSRK